MENPLYHVLLDGRRVGPYDRRTIVGMRIKKTLTSAHRVVAGNGQELTVGELVRKAPLDGSFEASRSGSHSVVQAVHSAALAAAKGVAIPAFRGEIEVRVQTKALRIAGRCKAGLRWKEDRAKFPLQDIVHVRARGSVVDLALRPGGTGPLQQLALELFTPESAGELVAALPPLAPWPEAASARGPHPLVWGAVVGTALVVGTVLVWVLTHRV